MNVSGELELCDIDTVDWPREGRLIMNEAGGLLTLAMLAAAERTRDRSDDSGSSSRQVLLEKANRFQAAWIDVLRRRLHATNPKHRAHYDAHDRCLILQWAAERGWSAKQIAAAFAIDESTARHWLQEWRDNPASSLFCGVCAWNSYDVALKDLVHRVQSLFPELEIGARTRNRRSSLMCRPHAEQQRECAAHNGGTPGQDIAVEPFHVLKPEHINHVWHADFTKVSPEFPA